MMWPTWCSFIAGTSFSQSMTLSTMSSMNSEIKNIIIMTGLSMIMLSMTMFKESSETEKDLGYLMMFIGMMVCSAFVCKSELKFIIMMEMTIIPISFSILMNSKGEDKEESIKFMVLMNTIGSIPFLTYLSIKGLKMNSFNLNHTTSLMVTLMQSMIFLVKTPMMMTHLWLTKVHVSASGVCSMILASIMIKMGTLGLFKFWNSNMKEKWYSAIMSFSMISALVMSLMMSRYIDSKTLIAMSSILHMAMLIPMMMMKKSSSMTPSIMMMSSHGLISYYLFFIVTMSYEKSENRTSMHMKSLEASSKMMSMQMTTFMFLNLGLPPFMNFYSEMMILGMMKSLNSNSMCVVLMASMVAGILFTMNLNTKMLFFKSEKMENKSDNCLMNIAFMFFLFWTFQILWYL